MGLADIVINDQREFSWTDTGGGANKRDPTVTVTSWFV